MSRDCRVCLEDIVEAASVIGEFLDGVSRAEFGESRLLRDAVVRNLEVIGEASKRVPMDVRGAIAQVDWRKASGMRDILIHEYFGIDFDIVWDVAVNRVPEIEVAVRRYLEATT